MSSPQIYEGFWQNHSIAGVWGWTWTLSTSRANYLLVFLGIYLGFVGGAFWSIIGFILHQFLAGKVPGDGIHHQIQLILRNTSSPLSAARELALVAFQWRKVEARSRIITPLLFSLLPLTIGIGFIVAGVESTKVSAGESAINDVKIKAQNCGQSRWDSTNTTTNPITFAFWLAKTAKDATAYVEDCYGNATVQQIPYVCTYAIDQIRYALSSNQPCPFNESLCFGQPNTSMTMETVYDSHSALGINAPVQNRIFVRKSVTCSVLDHSDHSNYTTTTNSDGSNTTVHYLFFGSDGGYEYTYAYTEAAASDGFGYELIPVGFSPNEENDWTPIPEFSLANADVTLFILSANGVAYLEASDDPWFAAHDGLLTPGFYRADDDFQVLGCTERYQICPTAQETSFCTAFNSRYHVYEELQYIGLNEAQVTTAELVMNISETANMLTSVLGIGSTALLARDRVFQDLLSGTLPGDQWKMEASNFFAISLARLQEAVLDFVSKSYPFVIGQNLIPPSPNEDLYLCHSQKIRDIGGYESFTAAAVWLIIIVGLIILILSATIDSCFAIIQRRYRWKYYRIMQWATDGIFQQQRIAMAESGYGSWTGAFDEIPLTARGDLLAVPRVDDAGMLVY